METKADINAGIFGAVTEASGESSEFLRIALGMALVRLTPEGRVQFIRDCRESLGGLTEIYDTRRWHSLQNLADIAAADDRREALKDASEGDFTIDHVTVDLEGASRKRSLSIKAKDIDDAVNKLMRHYQNSTESVLHVVQPPVKPSMVSAIQQLSNGDFAVAPMENANIWLEIGNLALRIQKNPEGCIIRRYPSRNTDSIPTKLIAEMDWDETLTGEYQGGISGTNLQVFDAQIDTFPTDDDDDEPAEVNEKLEAKFNASFGKKV